MDYPRLIKVGNVAIKIYRAKHPRARTGWVYSVAAKDALGKRRLIQFANEQAAVNKATEMATDIAKGDADSAHISRSDWRELAAAKKILGGHPLLSAIEEWAKARELVGPSIVSAAEAWAENTSSEKYDAAVGDVVDAFRQAKIAAGVNMKAGYDKTFPTFLEAFGGRGIASVTSLELQDWLNERYSNAVSRNTFRRRIIALFRWASANRFLPRDKKTEAEFTAKARESDTEIGIINVDTASRFLCWARKKNAGEFLATAALAIFCGLRRAELLGQAWKDVMLDRGLLRVTKAKPRTPARRLVPLSDAAIAWLSLVPEKKRNDMVCPRVYGVDFMRKIAIKDGFKLPDNCFRHGFISHRVAQTGNVAETSIEAGNTPKIIFRHYRELVTKAEGEAWFAIMPK